jgi:hypothetical protein
MQLQITPGASPNPLPNGSGVFLDRASVLTQFQTSVHAPFAAGTLDFFQQPIAAPLRILSASDVLSTNCVQSVSLGSQANTSTTLSLAAGTYYYAVTALDASGNESLASAIVAPITIGSGQEVNISWPPASSQPQSSEIASYNVYRGEFPAGTWTPVANVAVTTVGGTATDQGQTATPKSPPMTELATWFDSSIVTFFNYYDANTLTLTSSTAGYGSASNVTWQYSFSGTVVTDSVTNLCCLQFLLMSVLDLSEATPTEVAAGDLPFPLQTPFNIYHPYWNTNSFDPDAPAPAPYPGDIRHRQRRRQDAESAALLPRGFRRGSVRGVLPPADGEPRRRRVRESVRRRRQSVVDALRHAELPQHHRRAVVMTAPPTSRAT